tara:strand:- start:21 stop:326 length:306 start_codon:yes stop_codon:yes gene_type:complete
MRRKRSYEEQKEAQLNIRKRNRKFVAEYKTAIGCIRCGYNEHPHALELHHTDPTIKEITVARLSSLHYSIERIKTEVDKCEVVCANCHRIIHHEEKIGVYQ